MILSPVSPRRDACYGLHIERNEIADTEVQLCIRPPVDDVGSGYGEAPFWRVADHSGANVIWGTSVRRSIDGLHSIGKELLSPQ